MNSELPVWLNNQELSSIEYWDSEEKYYHDDLYERGQSNFADSTDSSLSFTISVPPLDEYIWRHAHKQNLSLFDSALEIHNSKNAKAFRKWLGDIEFEMRIGGRP